MESVRIRQLRKFVEPMIIAAEVLYGPSRGPEKRQFIIDSLNAQVDIPFLSEKVEESLIGVIIDIMVDVLNEQGHLQRVR